MAENLIKKIVLDLKGVEVSLTLDQCKQLKDALDKMFGGKVVHEYHDHHHHDWAQPYWYWQWPHHDYVMPTLYASSTSDTSSTSVTGGQITASYNASTETLKLTG